MSEKPTEIIIRPSILEDVSKILALSENTGLSSWTNSGYEAELKRSDSIIVVATLEKNIIGFISARLITLGGECEILNIAVQSEFRNSGVGKILLETVFEKCQKENILKIYLEVRESNMNARRFYARNGFVEVGIRKNFYTNPSENGILMMHLLQSLES